MKIVKNPLSMILLSGFLMISVLKAQNPGLFFLKDTIYECSGLKLKIGKSYWKSGTMKMKLIITNMNDFPVVIDPEDVVMRDAKGAERNPDARKLIAIPAKDIVKVRFVIRGLAIQFSDPLALTIKKVGFADSTPETFSQLIFPAKLNTVVEEKSLSMKVMEATNRDENYAVKVEMNHTGNKLLEMSYQKASLVTERGKFFNHRKSSSFFDRKGSSQNMLMIFPCVKKYRENGPITVDLNDVFKEYSIAWQKECFFKLHPITEKEYESKQVEKEEKEGSIEEIE